MSLLKFFEWFTARMPLAGVRPAMCTNKIVKNADLFSTHPSGKYNKENIGGFTMCNDE